MDNFYISWEDYRNNATSGADIYAQKINSTGTAQWTANGLLVTNTSNNQLSPAIEGPDSSGDFYITWHDYRSGFGSDIYAQKVNSAGTTQWGSDAMVTNASSNQEYPDGHYCRK